MSQEDVHKQVVELQAQLAALSKETGIMGVSVKLSSFWPEKPKIWFAMAEAQFEIANITQDATKYGHVLSMLDARLADQVEDIISNPPARDKYEYLKTELIKRFSTSREHRVKQLLGEEMMGDRKPSAFLRHLRSLAGTAVGDESIIRELWMRRLPQEVQRILMAQLDLPLDKVAEIADAIVDTSPPPPPAIYTSTSGNINYNNIIERLEELTKKVEALSLNQRNEHHSRSRDRGGRSRSRSMSKRRPDLCWYHNRFKGKATKCVSPCKWTNEGNGSSNH